MTPSEIITADAKQRNIDPRKVLSAVAQMVGKKVAVVLQENDTVVLFQLLGGGAAQVHLFTTDSALTLAKSLIKIYRAILQTKLDTLYGKADNPEILKLMRQVGIKVEDSDRPEFNWMAKL